VDNHPTISAGMAGDFQSADNARAKEIPIVQTVLLAYVVCQQLQVVFCEQLSGKETWSDDSLSLACTATCTATTTG
jgi:hypothetical protein